ncbi:29678_t:CDS:2, partial [Gigaspora margarita]
YLFPFTVLCFTCLPVWSLWNTDLTLVPALGGLIGTWLNPCHYLSQLRGCSQDMGKVVKDLAPLLPACKRFPCKLAYRLNP